MVTLEVGQVAEILDTAPVGMNVMLVGDTGIGKTQCVEAYCRERGIYLKTLILSQLEASETLGIPVRSTREWNGQRMDVLRSALPEWVFDLKEHEENAMLFLDEFLCGQPSVMNAFLNFLSQKCVQGVDLRKIRIVAATNVGNYTFDPDSNIISRFCWFYVVNTRMNEWLKDDRIVNSYKDENERTGVIFEMRSLKPRCQEQLMGVDDEHLNLFYEGFTNRKYIMVHKDPDINENVSPYFKYVNVRYFEIDQDAIPSMVANMMKTFNRIRKWDKIIASFINISMDAKDAIKQEVVKLSETGLV